MRWSFKEKSASLSLNKKILMKLVKMGIGLLLAFTGFSAIQAQTADEIVAKYIDALGGKDKLQQVKTVYMESTSQVMGNEGPSTINVINGVGYKLVSEMNGQTVIMVITDKGGWQVNPYAGATTPTALPDEIFKQGRGKLDAFGPLYNYVAKGNKIELQGKDGNAYKLKVTSSDSVEFNILIDATTYYMTKVSTTTSFMGQSIELTSTYSNFKKTDMGIVFPYSVEISYGGQFSITSTVNKVEFNKKIDPSIFDMPKS
jgi:outer membrane lipoprotein-sorting protein